MVTRILIGVALAGLGSVLSLPPTDTNPFPGYAGSSSLPAAVPQTAEEQLLDKLAALDNNLAQLGNLEDLSLGLAQLQRQTAGIGPALEAKLVHFVAQAETADGALEKELAELRDEVNSLKAQMATMVASQKAAAMVKAAAPVAAAAGCTCGPGCTCVDCDCPGGPRYPAATSVAVGGGSTGGYPAAASYQVASYQVASYPAAYTTVGGGSTGTYPAAVRYSYSTAAPVATTVQRVRVPAAAYTVSSTSSPVGECYIDANGNTVCPTAGTSTYSNYAVGGPIRRFFQRRR